VTPEPERLAEAQHIEELDLDYRKSPICVEAEAGHSGAARLRGGPHAGAQAPDASPLQIDDRSLTLYQLLQSTKHSLLLFSGSLRNPSAFDALESPAALAIRDYGHLTNVYIVCTSTRDAGPMDLRRGATIIGDPELALHNRYGAEKNSFYLIRPDGYIAYRDQPANAERLRHYLEGVFGGGNG